MTPKPRAYLWLCTPLLLLPLLAESQQVVSDSLSSLSAYKLKRMARQSERMKDWYSAIELYEMYLSKKPGKTAQHYDLALLYMHTRNYGEAEHSFATVISQDSNGFPKAYFYRGQMFRSLGKHREASACFKRFDDRYRGLKDRRKFRRLLKAGQEGLAMTDSIVHHPATAEARATKAINGVHSESAPLPTGPTTMLYAAVPATGVPMHSEGDSIGQVPTFHLYESTLENGQWQPGNALDDEINEPGVHVGNPVITPDGRYLFFTKCSPNWQGKMICRIYQSRKINDRWRDPELMEFDINKHGFTSTQPAIGMDIERNRWILYFVSDRPGGKGGLDIWYTRYNKRRDEWHKPRNCGSKVNSVGNEETPWYDLEGGILFFSSNGHPGIGGMDVYKAYGEKGRWSEPELLPTPFNSFADDTYYRKQPRERYHFVVSNRPGSNTLWNETCCDDIYEVFFPNEVHLLVRGRVLEVTENTSMENRAVLEEALVKLYVVEPGTGEKYLVKVDTIAADGSYHFQLEPRKQYVVSAEKPGYFKSFEELDLRKQVLSDTFETDLSLQRWDERPIILPKIYFEFDSDQLTAGSRTTIDTSLYELLVENPEIIIELQAHTDSKGTDAYNMQLSQDRAKSVVKYLVEKGIGKDRLRARGYGETRPIAPNTHPDGSDNPEGRARNRRIEFVVTGTKLRIIERD